MSFERAFHCIENRKRREGQTRSLFWACRNACLAPPRKELLSALMFSVVLRPSGRTRP